MANFNLRNITASIMWMTVIIIVVFAGDSASEARKRKRRHRGRGGKRRDQRISTEAAVLDALSHKKSHHKNVATDLTDRWTDAHLHAHTEHVISDVVLQTKGKFGYHSPTRVVSGRVVHVADPGLSSNYGCAHGIMNLKDIPSDEPWIALIKRGKCYFFNKIKLGELNNASAVVIYDDAPGKVQVISTIGTNIVALMVNQKFGEKLAKLADSGKATFLTIKVGKTHNGNHVTASQSPQVGNSAPRVTSHLTSFISLVVIAILSLSSKR